MTIFMLMNQKEKSFLEKTFKIQLTYRSKNVLYIFSILSPVERTIFLCNFCLIIFYTVYLSVCNIFFLYQLSSKQNGPMVSTSFTMGST